MGRAKVFLLRLPGAGLLIDGTGGKPLRDAMVVVEGSKIREVGRAGQVSVARAADWIKFYATGRALEATERAGAQEFSDEEIKVFVQEALRSGSARCFL